MKSKYLQVGKGMENPEVFRHNSDIFCSEIERQFNLKLQYDEEGVRWLDEFMDFHHKNQSLSEALLLAAGSYFGECIRDIFGGEWVLVEGLDQWAVKLSVVFSVFPLNKISKHYESGAGDSIYGMLQVIRVMLPHALWEKINELPHELIVRHDPLEVHPKESDGYFLWSYKTSISAKENVKIIEFGAYVQVGDGWAFSNAGGRLFRNKEFADWYGCLDGILQANTEYTDDSNWGRSDNPGGGRDRWFYIGETDSGRLVVGMAIVERLPWVGFRLGSSDESMKANGSDAFAIRDGELIGGVAFEGLSEGRSFGIFEEKYKNKYVKSILQTADKWFLQRTDREVHLKLWVWISLLVMYLSGVYYFLYRIV